MNASLSYLFNHPSHKLVSYIADVVLSKIILSDIEKIKYKISNQLINCINRNKSFHTKFSGRQLFANTSKTPNVNAVSNTKCEKKQTTKQTNKQTQRQTDLHPRQSIITEC